MNPLGECADAATAVDLVELAQDLVKELDAATEARRRMALETDVPAIVVADAVLVKMLLRNLIQNALQHTSGYVRVRIASAYIDIVDQGDGLPEPYRRLLTEQTLPVAELATLSGLGLFIVSLPLRPANQCNVDRVWFANPAAGAIACAETRSV